MQRSIGLVVLTVWLFLTSAGGGPGGTVQAAPDTEKVTQGSRLQGAALLGRNRHVVGATVLIRRSDETSRFFVTASDSKGRFRVDGLPDGDYRVEVRREGLGQCLCAEVFATGSPMVARNTTDCPRLTDMVADGESINHACVPLKFERGVLGVLNIAKNKAKWKYDA